MDSLFDLTCVPVRVTINKLNLAPNRNMLRFVSVFRDRRGLSTSKPYVSIMFFLSVLALISQFHQYTLCHIRMGSFKRHRLVLMVPGRL